MVKNPISDMLIRIKNAYLARHKMVFIPYSKLKKSLGDILVREGFLDSLELKGEGYRREIIVTPKYVGKKKALTDVLIVSKPSIRVYVSKRKIPKVLGGLGICILSTSKGLMTGKEAYKKNLGGELLCNVW